MKVEHHSLFALHIAPVQLAMTGFFAVLALYQTVFLAVKQTHVVVSLTAKFLFTAIS